MPNDLKDDGLWRCLCSYVNDERVAHCQDCGKRRWSQLGVSRNVALWLIAKLRKVA